MELVTEVVRPVVVVVVHLSEDLPAGRGDAPVQALPQRDFPRCVQEHDVPEPGLVGRALPSASAESWKPWVSSTSSGVDAPLSGEGAEDALQLLGPDGRQQHRDWVRSRHARGLSGTACCSTVSARWAVGVVPPRWRVAPDGRSVVQLRIGNQRPCEVLGFLAGGGHWDRVAGVKNCPDGLGWAQ